MANKQTLNIFNHKLPVFWAIAIVVLFSICGGAFAISSVKDSVSGLNSMYLAVEEASGIK